MGGSFLAYGTNGLRAYYRNFTDFGSGNETEESRIIRQRLCDYAADTKAQAAVEAIDAEYVIVFRESARDCGFIDLRGDYNESLFVGISSIASDTLGFTCIRETINLRVYHIDR